jgi:hypothetical protein
VRTVRGSRRNKISGLTAGVHSAAFDIRYNLAVLVLARRAVLLVGLLQREQEEEGRDPGPLARIRLSERGD